MIPFKVGDIIWSERHGMGRVIEIEYPLLSPYPVSCKFRNLHNESYTLDGWAKHWKQTPEEDIRHKLVWVQL